MGASSDLAVAQFEYLEPTKTPELGNGKPVAPPDERRFVVRARGEFAGEPFERVAGGVFLVQSAGAALDPRSLTVDRRNGDLELRAKLKADREGTYFVSAELWGDSDGNKPIAFARERIGHLTAGDHDLNLLFGGQVIRDSGIDGPYVVRNVRLLQVDSLPPHEAVTIDVLPKTRDYRAQDFF